jgi:hypothetical protein
VAAELVHGHVGDEQGQCGEKRWRPIAQSDYEVCARHLFNQASYTFPVETLLRLRCGSDVLIKIPADGRGNVRE